MQTDRRTDRRADRQTRRGGERERELQTENSCVLDHLQCSQLIGRSSPPPPTHTQFVYFQTNTFQRRRLFETAEKLNSCQNSAHLHSFPSCLRKSTHGPPPSCWRQLSYPASASDFILDAICNMFIHLMRLTGNC